MPVVSSFEGEAWLCNLASPNFIKEIAETAVSDRVPVFRRTVLFSPDRCW